MLNIYSVCERQKSSAKPQLFTDEVAANSKTRLGEIPFAGQGLILIEYACDGETLRNHFLYGVPPFDWAKAKEWMKETEGWKGKRDAAL